MAAYKEIKGFKVLPIRFSSTSTSFHELFFKENTTRQVTPDKPAERTLFILNIPPYATEESITRVFSKAGVVENVIFNKSDPLALTDNHGKNGFKNAFVVFENPLGVLKALSLTQLDCLSTPEHPLICGLKKWAQEHHTSIPNKKTLKLSIEKSIKEYDERMELEKAQEQHDKEAKDGWTLVTKQSRNPGLPRTSTLVKKIKQHIETGKKKRELKNFYSFQIRESKMKHLANLRQKFEEDKKKIDLLKQARRFKPY